MCTSRDWRRLTTNGMNSKTGTGAWSWSHFAMLLTQIGPEHIRIVNCIRKGKDAVSLAMAGNCLANAEQTVRRKDSPTPLQGVTGPSVNTVQTNTEKCNYCKKRGHVAAKCWRYAELRPQRDSAVKPERSASGSPGNTISSS